STAGPKQWLRRRSWWIRPIQPGHAEVKAGQSKTKAAQRERSTALGPGLASTPARRHGPERAPVWSIYTSRGVSGILGWRSRGEAFGSGEVRPLAADCCQP